MLKKALAYSFFILVLSCSSKEDGSSEKILPVLGPVGHLIPSFAFPAHTGDSVHNQKYEGKVYVTDFIFTRCATMCPMMTRGMKRVQDSFRNEPNVMFASFTVDPENDLPDTLQEYATQYEAIEGKWYYFTGAKDQIYHLARKGFMLPVGDGDGGEMDFIHSPNFVLVDQKSRVRGYYDGTLPEALDSLVKSIRFLLENGR